MTVSVRDSTKAKFTEIDCNLNTILGADSNLVVVVVTVKQSATVHQEKRERDPENVTRHRRLDPGTKIVHARSISWMS